MPTATFSVTAANFAVGQDIFTVGTGLGVKQAQQGNGLGRKLMKFGMVGSTNPGDCGLDLYAGGKYIGSFMNTTGGANVVPKEASDLVVIQSEDIIPANVTLLGIVNDAASTNPVQVTLVWEDAPVMGGAFRSDKIYTGGGGGYGASRRGSYTGRSGGWGQSTPRRSTRRRTR